MEDARIAEAVGASLAARIGAQRYELWFGSMTRLAPGPDGLKVVAASPFVRDWLRTNFAEDIRASWEAVAGTARSAESIAFEVDAELDGNGTVPPATVTSAYATAPSTHGGGRVTARPDFALGASEPPAENTRPAATRPPATNVRGPAEYAFEGFEVGPCNEYAYRSAELTAHGRQQASPVVWFGPTGVGKTHLLRAIVRDFRRRFPRRRAVYLTAEQFTTSFLEALRGSGLPSFRQKCRGADLLAIDDLQFFLGKARTSEELQHTIDTLLAEGRQLVLASDRPLGELRALGPELASRLAGGLMCQIEPPEYATRLGILRRLRVELQLTIDDEQLARVAEQINGGARELRGALHRLSVMAVAAGEPVTPAMAEEALRELARQCTRPVRLADVEHAVCDLFGVEPAELRSERKGRAVCEPRMLAMWLARKYTRVAWSEIGQFFGRRSHSTVIAAHRRVERLIRTCGEVELADRSCRVEEAIRRLEAKLRTA